MPSEFKYKVHYHRASSVVVHLKFDAEKRFFVPAPDPTIETLEAIRDLIPANGHIQKELIESIRNELRLGKDKALGFLKKGEGAYWRVQTEPGKNNQKTYKPVFGFSAPYIRQENQKTSPDRHERTQKTDAPQHQVTSGNIGFSGFRSPLPENQKSDPDLLDPWTGPAEIEVWIERLG